MDTLADAASRLRSLQSIGGPAANSTTTNTNSSNNKRSASSALSINFLLDGGGHGSGARAASPPSFHHPPRHRAVVGDVDDDEEAESSREDLTTTYASSSTSPTLPPLPPPSKRSAKRRRHELIHEDEENPLHPALQDRSSYPSPSKVPRIPSAEESTASSIASVWPTSPLLASSSSSSASTTPFNRLPSLPKPFALLGTNLDHLRVVREDDPSPLPQLPSSRGPKNSHSKTTSSTSSSSSSPFRHLMTDHRTTAGHESTLTHSSLAPPGSLMNAGGGVGGSSSNSLIWSAPSSSSSTTTSLSPPPSSSTSSSPSSTTATMAMPQQLAAPALLAQPHVVLPAPATLLDLQILAHLYTLQAAAAAAAPAQPPTPTPAFVNPALASLLAQQQQPTATTTTSSSLSPTDASNAQSAASLAALASLLRLQSAAPAPYAGLHQQQFAGNGLAHPLMAMLPDPASLVQPTTTRINNRDNQRLQHQGSGLHQVPYNRMAHLESILSRAEKQTHEERSRMGHVKQEQDDLPGKRKRTTDGNDRDWTSSDADQSSSSGSSDEGDDAFTPQARRKISEAACGAKEILYKRKQATPKQVVLLEQVFAVEPIPTSPTKLRLAKILNMSPKRVSVWFKNKRARQKKKGIPLPHSQPSLSSAASSTAAAHALATINPAIPRGSTTDSD